MELRRNVLRGPSGREEREGRERRERREESGIRGKVRELKIP